MRRLRVVICSVLATGMGFTAVVGLARPGFAAVLECPSGDVPCLIAAINTAKANGEVNTIRLAAGTYTLTAVDNTTDGEPGTGIGAGANGLASITTPLTIVGAGAENTIIEREATAPSFRLLHVGKAGLLKLEGLTVRGGRCGSAFAPCSGGGLFNGGTAIISLSTVANNLSGGGDGGGIASLGTLVIAKSTIANNQAGERGGGFYSPAGVTVVNSTISGNVAETGGGLAAASATIIGSTIVNNLARDGGGGGLASGNVAIINSTIAHNTARVGSFGAFSVNRGIIVNSTIAYNTGTAGTIVSATSALALQNTVLSTPGFGAPTCLGAVTSLDNNFFTEPKCAVTLLPHDQMGDPGLGAFTDDGTPGGGYVPLLAGSPALGAGNDAACLPTDQRGQRRTGGACDIGAIEGPRP